MASHDASSVVVHKPIPVELDGEPHHQLVTASVLQPACGTLPPHEVVGALHETLRRHLLLGAHVADERDALVVRCLGTRTVGRSESRLMSRESVGRSHSRSRGRRLGMRATLTLALLAAARRLRLFLE